MAPLFSVVIPTYNRSELVQGAVRSILRQTCGDFEIVVSDNCSEDDTREVVCSFTDPRVRYVRTPAHTSIGGSWEFARSQARGTLVMMLSDDDALLEHTLERFAEEHRRLGADFLFCQLAEYRDCTYPGPERNTVTCKPFSGTARLVSRDEFLKPLFAFAPKFDMHPSGFMFSSRIAERVAQRSGRFFRTNGVEYFAWPLAATYATGIAYLEEPLVILGRTFKSWGTTIVLSNPGKEQIDRMIADVEHDRDWVPLKNFTLCNLMAEGLLLGKKMFPDELLPYPFDEQNYLRRTMTELRHRQALGVDVGKEICETLSYAEKYPALRAELAARANGASRPAAARRLARAIGLGLVRRRIGNLREIRRIRRGEVTSGFFAAGEDFGFRDAVECADFLRRVTRPALEARR